MSNTNRGKDFESKIRDGFLNVPYCTIDRIHDQTNGFAGSSNICDFIAYRYPNIFYLECKTCYGNTLNFHNITDKQWAGLYEKSKVAGVWAGIIVWFIDHDITLFVPIDYLVELRRLEYKSLNINLIDDMSVYVIPGTKKRVFFDYDMKTFLDEVQNGTGRKGKENT